MSAVTEAPGAPAPAAAASAGYRYYVLFALTLVSFFNYMDRMVLAVLVEPIKADLGLSDTQIGLLSGFAFAILYATLGLPLARLADRKSRTIILSICVAVWSAMTAACGLAANFVHMLLARVGVGVGEAGCVPTSHSLIGDYFPADRRAFAVSMFQAGGIAGLSLGLMATGYLAEAFGWRAAFVIVGAPGILLALLVVLTVREPPRGASHARAASQISFFKAIAHLARRPAFVHLVAGLSIGSFATYGLAQWLAAFFIRVHDFSLSTIGLWSGLSAGGGAVAGVLVGGAVGVRLIKIDRRWELWLPALAYGIGCPFYLGVFLSPDPWVAIALKFFAGFIVASGGGVALAAIQSLAEPHLRATAIAIMMFFSALIGLGAGPFFVGLISDALLPTLGERSIQYALVIVTTILALASLHFYLASRTMRRDMVQ
ncbi:MAG: MFS transporter [Alphaproteobacteria bacterium]|nr:MFS transporter [Alphaproteobacteria bacterium]